MDNQTPEDRNQPIELSMQGGRNCISVGKGVIRALGTPSHVTLKVSETNDFISVLPCDEDDIMSFRVPTRLLSDHKCVMRINSKRFVHGIMKANNLDVSRTYTLTGYNGPRNPDHIFQNHREHGMIKKTQRRDKP